MEKSFYVVHIVLSVTRLFFVPPSVYVCINNVNRFLLESCIIRSDLL